MAKTKAQKHKAKRKEKQKQRRIKNSLAFQKEKADFLFNESLWLRDQEKFEEALSYAEKALRLDPKNKEMLHEMGCLGYRINRTDVELKALLALYDNGFIKNEQMPGLCILLEKEGKYEHALSIAEETLPLISKMKIRNKKTTRADILQIQKYCKLCLKIKQNGAAGSAQADVRPPRPNEKKRPAVASSKRTDREKTPPRIPESVEASAPPKKETYPEFRTNPASCLNRKRRFGPSTICAAHWIIPAKTSFSSS